MNGCRIEAARLLGWREIPVTILDIEDLLSAERDENTERKDFTPTEAVAIGRLIEVRQRAKIEVQEHERKTRPRTSVKNRGREERAGDTREIAARAVGMSATRYGKAKNVVVAAESDPAKFGDLAAQMDSTGNVAGAHQEMKRRQGTAGTNGKKHRHPVHRKTHYPKPNRTVERATWALAGICDGLNTVNPAELDAGQGLLSCRRR